MEKLEELILYIAKNSADDKSFSATKLNKILFIADFLAYGNWGIPITEATYVRRQYGPVPNEILIAQRHLKNDGRGDVEESVYFGHKQKRTVALDDPNTSLFTSEELELVDQVLELCQGHSATGLSDWTHTLPPWLSANDGEVIPYEMVYVLEKMPVGQADIVWAESEIEKIIQEESL